MTWMSRLPLILKLLMYIFVHAALPDSEYSVDIFVLFVLIDSELSADIFACYIFLLCPICSFVNQINIKLARLN